MKTKRLKLGPIEVAFLMGSRTHTTSKWNGSVSLYLGPRAWSIGGPPKHERTHKRPYPGRIAGLSGMDQGALWAVLVHRKR